MPAAPEWFILLPALAFLAWRWPRLGLRRPLRLAAALLAVLLLSNPRWPTRHGGLDLWVLLDRSESTEDLVDRNLPEWRSLLEQYRPGRRDAVHFLDYAAEVLPAEPDGSTSLYASRRAATRTAMAASQALARQDQQRPARILVFTDGFATEPMREIAAKLAAQGIPLDFRLIQNPPDGDTRLTRFEAPSRVQPGEAFVLRVAVAGNGDREVPVKLRRDGAPVGDAVVKLKDGRGSVELVDRLPAAGAHRYEAEIIVENDTHPGNNTGSAWVEITGGPRVILVTRHPDDPLIPAFRSQGIDVAIVTNTRDIEPGILTGARAVVINNVPAFDLPRPFLLALDFFVREQGGGLLMAGGKFAFGSGGYFQSPVDPLLPVSMELKTEHRKLAVAMAIVMDRSGSMAAGVPGPAGAALTKMDLANAGAAAAIELLGATDEVAVFAVDSEAHAIVPLTPLGGNKAELIGRVRTVRSMGGGIFVYTGLKAAWDELKRSPAGTRHVILFADAADAEEPGDYKNLLDEMKKGAATVSVIGLGTRKDVDAAFLEDVASRGGGRIQFTDQAAQVPQLFAMETVTVARSAFLTDPVAVTPTGAWAEVSGQPLEWLKTVDGYNLSYARPEAAVALVSADEYAAPLVATMRRGSGRSAAVSFPIGGDYSESSRAWPAYGDFLKTLARWLCGPELPPGLGLTHRLDGSHLAVNLHYASDEWARRLAKDPPRLKLAIDDGQTAIREIPWQRMAPGHFSAALDLEENQVVRGVVQAGEHTASFGPVAVGVSTEWALEPERLEELRAVARTTGGRELRDLSQAWLRPPVILKADLRLPLAVALLVLILLDAFQTRWQWTWRERFGLADLLKAKPRRVKVPVTPRPAAPVVLAPSAASASEVEAAARRQRFERAKRGKG
jgi:hypothetical protein